MTNIQFISDFTWMLSTVKFSTNGT